MRTELIALAAGALLMSAGVAAASDGGQASVSSLNLKPCPRLPDDISLGGGLYMCARIDCSPPPGYTPPPGCNQTRNVVLVPNGDLALNPQCDIIQASGPQSDHPPIPDCAGATGYDGSDSSGP